VADTKPYYFRNGFTDVKLEDVLLSTPWVEVTDARQECFMSATPGETYTYGSGRGVRTYTSVAYSELVKQVQHELNRDDIDGLDGAMRDVFHYNVCFLNRYDDAHKQLGWHSDDSPGMLHEHPIAVVSFGEPREIWWRPFGFKGVVPNDQRQLLEHGSVFVMPPGFQLTHQHRIPKGDREMGCRVSLTFRRYVP
jgi:alkylated DNA repair dioxygenase AlkB